MDNIAINQILLLLLQCVIIGSLLLSLFRLRSIFGLSLVYITLGAFQFLQVFLANGIFFEIATGMYVSPGSMVLFTASLFAILIVYIREDALETRKIIYAVIAINIILSFLQQILSWAIEIEGVINVYDLPKEFFLKNARFLIGGTLALAIDAFLVIYFYEKIAKFFKPLFLRVFSSMAIVLIIDSLMFSLIAYLGTPLFSTVLISGIISKLFAVLIYSILFTLYLLYFEKEYFAAGTSESSYSDVFNALTFRQKYEQVFEEKETQKIELHQSEIKTQSIFQSIDDLVFVLDKDNRFTAFYANPDSLYLEAEGFIGKTIVETMPAHVNQLFEEVLPEVKKGKIADFEYDMDMPKGKAWYSIKLSPIMENGSYIGLAAVSRDITERKEASEIISQSNERLTDTLESMSDGFVSLNKDWIYTDVNSRAAEMFGRNPEDLIGKHIWTEFPEAIDQPFYKTYYKVAETQESIVFEDYYSPRDRWFENKVIPTKEGLAIFFQDITERKTASEAIRKSEARLTEAQKIAKIGSWELELVTNTLSWSDEVYRIFDLKPQQFKATYEAFLDNIHPDDRSRVNQAYTESVKNKTPYTIEHRLLLKDGSIKFVKEHSETFYNDLGNAIRSFGTVQDITQIKLAEDAMRKNEVELKEAQRIAKMGSWFLNLANNEVVWTEELYKMYSANPELPPPPFTEHQKLFTSESWGRLSKAIPITSETGVPYELELETVREDGSNGWMWVRGEQVKDNNGEVVGLRGAAQDITKSKQAEIALLASQTFNQTVLDTSPDLIYIYDILERKNIYSNAGITKILGYSKDEIQKIGENLLPDLMHPDDFNRYLKEIIPLYQTAADEQIIEHDYRMKHKDGAWRWLNSKETIFMRQEDGTPKQIFGLTSDITDRKKYMAEINQLNINLEQKVEERTLELAKQNKRLEKMNKVFVGRENRMAELKKEIEKLKNTSADSV